MHDPLRDAEPAEVELSETELIAAVRRRLETYRPRRHLPAALDRLAQLFDPQTGGTAAPPADSDGHR